jgi:hypothetical protein
MLMHMCNIGGCWEMAIGAALANHMGILISGIPVSVIPNANRPRYNRIGGAEDP